MSTFLDTNLLASLVRHKRGSRGLRDIAREVGDVSPSTLSRVENGKTPDMDTFLKLCDWLGENATRFIKSDAKSVESSLPDDPVEQLAVHLRADKTLDPASAAAIAAAVRGMVTAMRKPSEGEDKS